MTVFASEVHGAGSFDGYRPNEAGIFVPQQPVAHRDEEYDPAGFDLLRRMQEHHFWYRGRHRFLLAALKRALRREEFSPRGALRGVDLGGGCGGWVHYLQKRSPRLFAELALADSSLRALALATDVVGRDVKRYQVDLLRLGWRERWDVAFLLDVLEHIPDDAAVLGQIRDALRPGGLLLVATPALDIFWSHNDEMAHHLRRYSRRDFPRLAAASGLTLRSTRYFMFFLSPLLVLSRLAGPSGKGLNAEEERRRFERSHRVPAWPVNELLSLTFALETPVGLHCPFPWGTSVLAVFQRE
ncbi:MAG TPA: class I SAM-dependent methyltransferase [Pirellulales bacterium]|jgi:SAM-dependent methyltransferase|nr:class I SAM-dependent methyltransferase [Pirellulales bacterium]